MQQTYISIWRKKSSKITAVAIAYFHYHKYIQYQIIPISEFIAVYYYNFALKDYGDATMGKLLDMVKVVSFAVQEGRVAIHCHAGKSIFHTHYT